LLTNDNKSIETFGDVPAAAIGNEYNDPREIAFADDFSAWLKVFDRVREQTDVQLVVNINSQ
jgi:hypothetical protein